MKFERDPYKYHFFFQEKVTHSHTNWPNLGQILSKMAGFFQNWLKFHIPNSVFYKRSFIYQRGWFCHATNVGGTFLSSCVPPPPGRFSVSMLCDIQCIPLHASWTGVQRVWLNNLGWWSLASSLNKWFWSSYLVHCQSSLCSALFCNISTKCINLWPSSTNLL